MLVQRWACGCWAGGDAPCGEGSLQVVGSAPSLDCHRDPRFGWPECAEGEPCDLWESSWDSRLACGLALLGLGDGIGFAR